MLIALVVIIPIGLCYRLIEIYQLEKIGIDSEWTGIILIFLVAMEVYLLVLFTWLRLIMNKRMSSIVKLIQLLIISIIGILPSILSMYTAFFKD
jgi:hypothetical protein